MILLMTAFLVSSGTSWRRRKERLGIEATERGIRVIVEVILLGVVSGTVLEDATALGGIDGELTVGGGHLRVTGRERGVPEWA